MTHTPGPWKYLHTPAWNVWMIFPCNTNSYQESLIASHVNGEDNAHLIATAPELLEALEYALKVYEGITTDNFTNGYDKPARDKMRAAIAKAKGETK